MNENQYLQVIYGSIKVGMRVPKPRKTSEILNIKENGNIYYRIGNANEKAVTKTELSQTYGILKKRRLSNSHLNDIATSSKPCNVTTIKWLLTHSGVAIENADGTFSKAW